MTLHDYVTVCRMSRQRGDALKHQRPITVNVPILDRLAVSVRPGTSDASVLIETLVGEFHLPPEDLHPKVIWDLGANIGLTAAHYAVLYPDARIYCVEANPDLVAITFQHTSPWRERVEVIEAAVWPLDEDLFFSVSFGDEYGGTANLNGRGIPVRGRSLNTLIPLGQTIDLLKMDIEGAEKRVLREHTDWASRVRCLKVECHDDYSREDCIRDLQRLGFQAEIDPCHWSCVIGNRTL
jgi:FkbM family methyltransferase